MSPARRHAWGATDIKFTPEPADRCAAVGTRGQCANTRQAGSELCGLHLMLAKRKEEKLAAVPTRHVVEGSTIDAPEARQAFFEFPEPEPEPEPEPVIVPVPVVESPALPEPETAAMFAYARVIATYGIRARVARIVPSGVMCLVVNPVETIAVLQKRVKK